MATLLSSGLFVLITLIVLRPPRVEYRVPYNGIWKDLGTWNTVTEEMVNCTLGEVIKDDHCKNTHAINVLDIKHMRRSEVIAVIGGCAQIIMDGSQSALHVGDNVTILPDTWNSIKATEELRFLELQTGILDPADICRETYAWDKIEGVC